ncbi:MAG: MFS transporter [Gluconacetobacter diazotrophicus]|nr:MFS transporter [Gluconacetobacter diazotrophicus]
MLAVTTLAILVTSMDMQILPTILPAVLDEFHLGEAAGGWLNALFFAGVAVGAVLFGIASDLSGSGHRRGLTWIVAYVIAVIGGALTFLFGANLLAFNILRVFMGLSRGGSEPSNVALVSDWWQRENRGFAIGVHHTGFPVGQFLGPAIMALVLTHHDWRATYLLIPAIGIPVILAQLAAGTRRNERRVRDWIVAHGLTPPFDADAGAGGRRFRSPRELFRVLARDRNTAACIAVIFLFLWAELGISSFLTVYLTKQLHMSLPAAATASGASGLTGWIGQVVWGTASDRLGRKPVIAILAGGWALSTALLIAISTPGSAWALLLFWGLFRNAPFPVAYSMLIDSVGEASGSAMGLMIGISFGVCGLVVAPVAGWCIQHLGWTADYAMLAAASLLSLVPLRFTRETVSRSPARA